MTFALVLTINCKHIFYLPLFAFLSFSFLFFSQREQLLPKNVPILGSYASQITFLRFLICSITALYLVPLSHWVLFFLFGFTIFLDGVDGFIARKYQQESPLGALLDKTMDAYFVLLLIYFLIQNYEIPMWFIGIGYLHYGYELLMQGLGWTNLNIPKNPIGKYVAALFFISLLSPFILPANWHLPLMYSSAFLICCSFSLSFWHKYQAAVKVSA